MVEQFKILRNFLFSIFFKFDLIISIGIKDKEEERIFEFKGNTEAGKKLIKCMKI